MDAQYSSRDLIIEICNRLFYYTDHRNWEALKEEVFTDVVYFDMTSLGAKEAVIMASQKICDLWDEGFQGIDAIHHQAGNYLVEIENDHARVTAYAIATHYKESASQGKTRTFVGSYDLGLKHTDHGWRIHSFKYNLKYVEGNTDFS